MALQQVAQEGLDARSTDSGPTQTLNQPECRPRLPLQQNLGAILRSAWCLGASGLLAAAKNCAPLSPSVSKVGPCRDQGPACCSHSPAGAWHTRQGDNRGHNLSRPQSNTAPGQHHGGACPHP